MAFNRVVLKIGGSIITDRDVDEPAPLKAEMHRTAQEIADFTGDLVLVHGAGSYGHPKAANSDLHNGINTDQDCMDLAVLQRLQNDLNILYCAILQEHDIPAFPLQASAYCTMQDGALTKIDTTVIEQLLAHEMVPVLYGTPAIDLEQDVAILSGDLLAPALAQALDADTVLHATDVDGVYAEFPPQDDTDILEQISTLPDVFGDSGKTSVTGGMEYKVKQLLDYEQSGRIFNGQTAGNIRNALNGTDVGTLVDPA